MRAMKLVGQGHARHRAVVCAQHNLGAAIQIRAQRMRLKALRRLGLYVARQTDFDGNLTIDHIIEQRRILEQVRAVTNALGTRIDRKSTRLNSSHVAISYAVFCLKKKKNKKLTQ